MNLSKVGPPRPKGPTLARKTIRVSDLSGKEISDGQGAVIRISFDDGNDNQVGHAIGVEQLCDQLIQLSGMFSEGAAMLFGGGTSGWHEIPGP